MDTGVQEGRGEPTRDDAVRGSIHDILQRPERALGKVKSRGSDDNWTWRSHGQERVLINVSYRDGPLDTSENMYSHETFPIHKRWHSRNSYFTTIIVWIYGLGVFLYYFNHNVYYLLFLLRAKKLLIDSWRLFITYGVLGRITKVLEVQHT